MANILSKDVIDGPKVTMTTGQVLELKEIALDMFNQACGEWKSDNGLNHKFVGYHHGFISSYENAQDFFLRMGWITKKECQIRTWPKEDGDE